MIAFALSELLCFYIIQIHRALPYANGCELFQRFQVNLLILRLFNF